jgi:glutamate/tyrosine decarboxylase-like PLP-dependent enzyme
MDDALIADAAGRAARYVSELPTRRVAPSPDAVARLAELGGPLPADGLDPAEVLRLLDEIGSPATVATAGSRYFGFVNGATLPAARAAAILLAAWDQNAALRAMSPVAAHLDDVALEWLVDLLGLPAGTGGGFVSGATMANATCLAAGRDAVLARVGWDAAGNGLVGAPPVEVVVGDEVHTTAVKALGIVGLGRGRARRLPVDDQGRIDPTGLPKLSGPTIVCLQAGNVNSGASDPFEPLIDWAGEQRAWVHVDGAFGLWANASPALREQVAGVGRADSWATDCHKWLNTTYDSGVALVRDPALLRSAMEATAAYLVPGAARDAMHYTPQSSQRARGAECWAALASLGRSGVADLIERCSSLAQQMADGIRAMGFEVRNEVVLNQVVVGFGDDARTAAVMARIQEEGTLWAGPTVWRGRAAMRISVSSWSTTRADIDQSLAAIARAAAG